MRTREPEAVAMGLRLKEFREELGLKRVTVAARLDLTEEAYGNYERGASRPVLTDVPRIAAAFGVSVPELLVRLHGLQPGIFAAMQNAEIGAGELPPELTSLATEWSSAPIPQKDYARELLRLAGRALRQSRDNAKIDYRRPVPARVASRATVPAAAGMARTA